MKLVIFDCDGTLIDSQHLIVACMNKTFEDHGMQPPAREATLSIVGLSLPQAIGRLIGDDARIAAMVESYKANFHVVRADGKLVEPLYEGCLEALGALRARGDVTLAIATGKSQRGVRLVMGHHGIYEAFASIQTADDAPSKPHPAMIFQALTETGISADNAVMVGDTTYDIDMAHNADVLPIGVTWGYHKRAMLEQSGCPHIINHFSELVPLLDKIWSKS